MVERHSPWDGIDPSALHEVTDPDQAAILTDPVREQFLRPFLARSRTVTEAADELGVRPNTLLYRVRRMEAVGLLRVVEVRPRAGRAVKVYRSSHDGYRVPMSAMRYDDLRHRVDAYGRSVMDGLARAYTAALVGAPHHDRVLARDRDGHVWGTDLVPRQNRHGEPLVYADVVLRLDHEQAVEASRRMEGLIADLVEQSHGREGGGSPFLVMGAVLPVPP